MIELGAWVIDTNTHRSGTVMACIPVGENSLANFYIINFDDKYEVCVEDSVVKYDKYYWDDLEES